MSVCTMPCASSRACDCAAGSCSKPIHVILAVKASNLGLKAAEYVGAQFSVVTTRMDADDGAAGFGAEDDGLYGADEFPQEGAGESAEQEVDILEGQAGGEGAGASAGAKARAVDPSQRVTTRYMTKYERARLLGTRALQLRCVERWNGRQCGSTFRFAVPQSMTPVSAATCAASTHRRWWILVTKQTRSRLQ